MNLYLKGIQIFKNIIPFLLLGAGMNITFDLLLGNPLDVMKGILQSFVSRTGIILLGITLYVCGGADILILKPLLHAELPLAYGSFFLTYRSFSLYSFVNNDPSFFWKKIIFVLTIYLAAFSFVFGEFLNFIL
jgi:uncharacterized membrane protein YraQ (UPF0718 family)